MRVSAIAASADEHRWVVVAILLLPRLAQACPMCANQQPGGVARIVTLGVMMLLPFAIAGLVFGALRRAGGLTTGKDSRGRAATDPGSEPARGRREPNL
jgi:hypothetical protein